MVIKSLTADKNHSVVPSRMIQAQVAQSKEDSLENRSVLALISQTQPVELKGDVGRAKQFFSYLFSASGWHFSTHVCARRPG